MLCPYSSQTQELLAYIQSFKSEDGMTDGSHPASLVCELLAEGDFNLRCQHLDLWYQEYCTLRGMAWLHKGANAVDTLLEQYFSSKTKKASKLQISMCFCNFVFFPVHPRI